MWTVTYTKMLDVEDNKSTVESHTVGPFGSNNQAEAAAIMLCGRESTLDVKIEYK